MKNIIDFNCTYNNTNDINIDITKNLNISFPEVHNSGKEMAILSKAIKNRENTLFCTLPFCHTIEGEAMGGIVNLGDENFGPRGKEHVFNSMDKLLDIPDINYNKGRISEVLSACKILKEEGEHVCLNVSGPFTIMNLLIDSRHIFKAFRNNQDVIEKVFLKFKKEILRFINEAKSINVDIISYADSSGGLNILGPKLSEEVVEIFTYPLVKEIQKSINKKPLIHLCPKTSFALIGTKKAEWDYLDVGNPMTYEKACINAIGKAHFIGETCLNNHNYTLNNGKIKTINIV